MWNTSYSSTSPGDVKKTRMSELEKMRRGGFASENGGVRIVVVCQIAFVVQSVGHIWGERTWNTPDTSTNNRWTGMFALGEGWHNNHHAFPNSARHGLKW
nr:delta-9 acyl-lipid desaturase 1-like [Tanacetum cinerariifolium]